MNRIARISAPALRAATRSSSYRWASTEASAAAAASAEEEEAAEAVDTRRSGSHEFSDPMGPGVLTANLSDPTKAIPVAIATFGTLTAAGLYHWNAESMVLGTFLLATGVATAKGGEAIGKYFDTEKYNLADEIAAAEEAALADDKELKDMYAATIGKDKHFEFFHETHKAIVAEENAGKTQDAKRAVRDKYERILKAYADIHDRKVQGVRSSLVEGSTEYVRAGFLAGSDEMKSKSLDAALAAIADPTAAAAPAELGQLYQQYFAEQKAKYEKLAAEAQPLSDADKDLFVEEQKRILLAMGLGDLGDKELESAARSKVPATMKMSL